MSFGIAFAGGGTRGAAHVGVLMALEEGGLFPSSVAGTSAGSIVAGLLASGMKLEDIKDVVFDLEKNGKYFVDLDLCGIVKSIVKGAVKREFDLSGLMKGERLEKYFWNLTEGKTLDQADRMVVIPAVDLVSGHTIVYTNSLMEQSSICNVIWEKDASISEAIRASSSVPAIFVPKWINGMCLVDGGVTNVLPVDLLMEAGEKNVLAVDISEQYESPQKFDMIEIVSHSYSIMSECLKDLTSTGEKYLLKPPLPSKAGLLTFEYMTNCMQAGYEYTKSKLPEIKKVFQTN